MNREIDSINEIRQMLFTVFQKYGVQRAVAYYSKEQMPLAVEQEMVLVVETGLRGLEFCGFLNEVKSTVGDRKLSILDIRHLCQWSDVDGIFRLKGTEIYQKPEYENISDFGYLKGILEIVLKVKSYCQELSYEQFERNYMLCEACEFNLHRIGQLSDCIEIEFKETNPQIPWSALGGLKNRLSYSFRGANKFLLWEIVQNDFTELQEKLEYVLADEEAEQKSLAE